MHPVHPMDMGPIWIPSGDTRSPTLFPKCQDFGFAVCSSAKFAAVRAEKTTIRGQEAGWIGYSFTESSCKFPCFLARSHKYLGFTKNGTSFHDHFGRKVMMTITDLSSAEPSSLHSFRDIPSSRISRSVSGRAGWICQNSGLKTKY